MQELRVVHGRPGRAGCAGVCGRCGDGARCKPCQGVEHQAERTEEMGALHNLFASISPCATCPAGRGPNPNGPAQLPHHCTSAVPESLPTQSYHALSVLPACPAADARQKQALQRCTGAMSRVASSHCSCCAMGAPGQGARARRQQEQQTAHTTLALVMHPFLILDAQHRCMHRCGSGTPEWAQACCRCAGCDMVSGEAGVGTHTRKRRR